MIISLSHVKGILQICIEHEKLEKYREYMKNIQTHQQLFYL